MSQHHHFTLTSVRGGNSYSFDCEFVHDTDFGESWKYFVRVPGIMGAFYEARFVRLDAVSLRPDMLSNYGLPQFKEKGLSKAVFKHVTQATGLRLLSSTNKAVASGVEYRTDEASGLWESLRKVGLATYDAQADRYTFTPKEPEMTDDDYEKSLDAILEELEREVKQLEELGEPPTSARSRAMEKVRRLQSLRERVIAVIKKMEAPE